jgi:hypothetical protein
MEIPLSSLDAIFYRKRDDSGIDYFHFRELTYLIKYYRVTILECKASGRVREYDAILN